MGGSSGPLRVVAIVPKILTRQKMFFEVPKAVWSWAARESAMRRTLVLCAAAVVVAGCASEAGSSRRRDAGGPLRVVATTTIVADLVRQVGGPRVEVDCLMAAGIDPHSYKATPRDADRLAAADLVVASGLHLEGRLADLLQRLGRRTPVVAVADALPRERLLISGPGIADPHVWFDASLWALTPPVVAAALADLDPAGAEAYHAAAAAVVERLERLHDTVRDRIASIPLERRVLVTAHDAFRYFGRAYAIEVVGVQGLSTESEAGLGDINRLVDRIVDRRIPAVFVETSVSDRNVTAIIEGAAARGHAVAVGGRLYSDALGGPGSGAETLEAALTANADTIVAALEAGWSSPGGVAPEAAAQQ